MSLREDTNNILKARRQRILDGSINSIPTPFRRFKRDFLGWEQATYYLITSFTKGGKTQLVSYLLFEGILYCYHNEDKTKVSMKVLYFPLEETKERIMMRFYSWLLFKKKNIRISPSDLRSSDNENPLSEDILNILEEDDMVDIIDYFEEHVIFSSETNPTGIYKFCKNYAEEHGKVIFKSVIYKDEFGMKKDGQAFDYYVPDNPNEYVFPVIDTINIVESERGYTKKETIDKLSEYCTKYLRNRYGQSPIIIQQQNTDNESIDSIKLSRNRPTTAGLRDSKCTSHDANIVLGIFSPYKFGLDSYLGYDIRRFKDHFRTLEVLANRDGELGGIVGLFFDGVTCTWSELPKLEDTENIGKMYAYLDKLDNPEYSPKTTKATKVRKSFTMRLVRKVLSHLLN